MARVSDLLLGVYGREGEMTDAVLVMIFKGLDGVQVPEKVWYGVVVYACQCIEKFLFSNLLLLNPTLYASILEWIAF